MTEQSGHEPSAVPVPAILRLGAVIAVTVIVIVLVVRAVLAHWVAPEHSLLVARSAPIPPPPRLLTRPDQDVATLRAQKRMLLSSWAWTDASHDFARIPIDRALTLYVRQHAPRTKLGADAPLPQRSTP